MDLPKINPERLAKVVHQVESNANFKSLMDVAFKVSQSNWAQEEELDSKTIHALILHHNTPTKTPKPGEEPKPAPVVAAPTKVVAAPAPSKPEPVANVVDFRKDEGGQGRKLCPTCSKYVGVRTQLCFCGYDFKSGAAVAQKEPEVKTDNRSDTGGLGRKECPACSKFVGVRTQDCFCGHKFTKIVPPKPVPVQQPVVPVHNMEPPKVLAPVQPPKPVGPAVPEPDPATLQKIMKWFETELREYGISPPLAISCPRPLERWELLKIPLETVTPSLMRRVMKEMLPVAKECAAKHNADPNRLGYIEIIETVWLSAA
jgi:hypothetical protein